MTLLLIPSSACSSQPLLLSPHIFAHLAGESKLRLAFLEKASTCRIGSSVGGRGVEGGAPMV